MTMRMEALLVLSLVMTVRPLHAAADDNTGKVHRTAITRDADGALNIDNAAPQVKDDLFEGTEKFAAKARESSEVNLDKSMLAMASKMAGTKGDLARKLDAVVVRSYQYEHEGDYKMADVEVYFKRLDALGWKHIVRTHEDKEWTDICVKQDREGQPRELVVISAEAKELTFVHITGQVSLADLQQLGGLAAGAVSGGDQPPALQKH